MGSGASLFAFLFRLVAFTYLRIIPVHRWGKFALPALYALHALFTLVAPKPVVIVVSEKVTVTDVVDTRTEQVVEEKVEVEEVAVVLEPANGEARSAEGARTRPVTTLDKIGSLLFGFHIRDRGFNVLSVLTHTVLLAFCLDFAYTPLFKTYNPTFTRVGALDHSSAKIVVRYPELKAGHLRVIYQRVHPTLTNADVWKEGPVLDIEEDKDWTAAGKITGLWPSAEYVYRLAYLNSTLLPYPEHPISFKTFPDPKSSAGTHFKFVVSSCMLPNFPYNPAFPERIKGLDILSDYIDSFRPKPQPVHVSHTVVPADPVEEAESLISEVSTAVASATETPFTEPPVVSSLLTEKPKELAPEFMLLLGDAIYADVPYWNGDDVNAYRKHYRRTFASSSYRKVYEKLPIFGIYDDHEIKNNFAGENNDTKVPFFNASSAYNTYYGDANPDPHESDVNYYDFRYGDNAFFVLDTRRYRSDPDADRETVPVPTMLGERQLHALHSWLGRVNNTATFKFIATSVPFTSLWHGFDGQKDSWAGYRTERDSILDVLMWVPNVVILSGDRHEFGFVEHRGKIPEISIGPLSMFAVPSGTLQRISTRTFEKKYIDKAYVDEEGFQETKVGIEVTEEIPEERRIEYIADGSYKFGSLEIDTRDWRTPKLILDAIINGKSAYKFEFVGQPVALSYTSSLAVSFGGVWKGVLSKIGLMKAIV